MKRHIILGTICMALAMTSCSLFPEGKDSLDPWASDSLSEFIVKPIPGGALISYAIPNDPDILYIMAEYTRNGEIFTDKASVHNNELKIEGFNTVGPVTATLYKVNHHEQKSDPLEITFTPLESPVMMARNSLVTKATFGGLAATWENETTTELGVHLYKKVDGEMVSQDVYFTAKAFENYAFRGFDSEETTFGIVFEDKWGNSSEMVTTTVTPFFETYLQGPYADLRSVVPYDNATDLNGTYPFSKISNNVVSVDRDGWLTKSGCSGASFTFDLGVVAKLSRVLQGYYYRSPWGQANIWEMEIWGSAVLDEELLKNKEYWLDQECVNNGQIYEVPAGTQVPEHTFEDDWEFLGRFITPDQASLDPADAASISENGMSWDLNEDAAPVRYIRVLVKRGRVAHPANYWSLSELAFFGDNTVSQ